VPREVSGHSWIILLALVIVAPCPAVAHQDTFFEILTGGTIYGIPDELAPVHIRVELRRSVPWMIERVAVHLQFGSSHRDLPHCLARMFQFPVGTFMTASGSWDHDLSLLPPYLTLNVPRRKNGRSVTRYSIVFDLRTGSVLEAAEFVDSIDGLLLVRSPIPLDALCSPREIQAMKAGPLDSGHQHGALECGPRSPARRSFP